MTISPPPTPERPVSERPPFRHSVVVLHAPTEASLGARIVVDRPLEVGRGLPGLPEDAASDRLLSRRHARLSADNGLFEVEDLGSTNGVLVNGERVTRAVLAAGDVLEIGEFAFIVDPAVPRRTRTSHTRIVGTSEGITSHVDALEAVAKLDKPVIVHGPAGAGKSLAAEELHLLSRRKGALVVAPCDRPGEVSRVLAELLRDDGSLAECFGGTLVLDSIDRASRDDVRKIPSVLGLSRERGIRVVVCSRQSPMDLASDLDDYAQILQGIVPVEVPALEARREDIPLLVRHFLAPLGASAPDLTRDFIATLVRGSSTEVDDVPMDQQVLARAMGKTAYPDNVRGLFAQLDACLGYVAIGGDMTEMVVADPDDDEEGETPKVAMRPAKIARDGTYVQVERERVHLRGRRALRSMVALLVDAALATPWEAVPVADLFGCGWPGEAADPLASAARVYLAMSTLRRVGLEGHVERTQRGYRLVRSADLDIVDPKLGPREPE